MAINDIPDFDEFGDVVDCHLYSSCVSCAQAANRLKFQRTKSNRVSAWKGT